MGSEWYRWVSIISLAFSFAKTAHAEPTSDPASRTESIFLDYEVAAGCPPRAAFFDQVRGYALRVVLATEPGSLRRFNVRVERAGGQIKGSLEILSRGETARREVSATTCGEVIDALALAAALAVDPSLLEAAPPEAPAAPTEPEPVVEQPQPTEPASPPPAPRPPLPVAQSANPLPLTRKSPPAAISSLQAGAEALAIWGLLPEAAYGAGLHLEYGASEGSRWLPNLVLGAYYVASGDAVKQGATVSFAAFGVEAKGCWVLGGFRRLHFDACPLIGIGKFMSELGHNASAEKGSRAWAALGLAGRVRMELSDTIELQVQSAIHAHLIHQEVVVVVVEPDDSVSELLVHETSGAILSLTAGIAYRF